MAQEVDALFTNFDASVYTIIFIPADSAGVLPPGAEKYLKQVEKRNRCWFGSVLCEGRSPGVGFGLLVVDTIRYFLSLFW